MKRMSNQSMPKGALLVVGLCLVLAPGLQAQETDMSSSVTLPSSISQGSEFTVTVGYANGGPDTASGAYINSDFIPPMGLDVVFDNLNNGDGSIFDAIQASAADALGNVPILFTDDDFYCETLLFQLQGDDTPDATPIQPLAAGESGSFTYNLTIPMDSPRTGTVEITSPASVAKAWTLTDPANFWVEKGYAGLWSKYATTTCDQLVGNPDEDHVCDYITDNCWGTKVSHLPEPIEAEFQLVDDGSANPTWGCGDFVDFVPGNIAVLERGDCEFGTKGFNAQSAGASAVFMVNSGLCSDFPDSDDCVINMGPGALGGLVTIPVIMVSRGDGLPIIAALQDGATIEGAFDSPTRFSAHGWAFSDDDDPDDTNDVSQSTVPVSNMPDPPVAAFTYSPASPVTGSPVQFTDASTGGAPDTWSWDFDDGGTSAVQNPSHTYQDAGDFTVSLTVSNAAGSDTATMVVTVELGADLTEAYFIPAAALAAGLEGAFYETDVDINNGSAADASYAFLWLPRGADNSDATQSTTYTLAAGASVRYENVLSAIFDLDPDVAGALVVMSNTTNLNIMSRTYNLPSAKVAGTFGQALPGVYSGDLIMQGETKRIIFMSENDDLRANLGCVNGVADDSVRIFIDLYDATGTMLETKTMDLPPYSNNQINQIFNDYSPVNGYADVRASKPGAAYYCYGSVLDNLTSDPTSVLPVEYGADTPYVNYYIPAAALAAGLEGSFYQTDVDINNAGASSTTYQFMWLPRGADNSSPTVSDSFTLAAGASVRYENVLSEVFDLTPDVAGALSITADSAYLGIMSRTYNLPTAKVAGTFGQALPGIPESNLIMQDETMRIIFMSENDDLRANLGCVNGVNDSLRIFIDLYDATGALLETKTMDLPPYSNNQINQIFSDYSPVNGYADVRASKPGAAYYCYGSVLDNETSDPTSVLPQ
jgi:PKD repeat protein